MRRLKNIAGASMFEVILALGVMAMITPIAFKFISREVMDIRNMGIANELRYIQKSLLNYASEDMKNWTDAKLGGIKGDVRETLVAKYGLNPAVPWEMTRNIIVKYLRKDGGYFEVFAFVDMSHYSLSAMDFKQVLSFIGDNAAYADNGEIYSITGAWQEDAFKLGVELKREDIAIIRITDADLDNGYASSEYLYRNQLGGDDGNTMRVSLDMQGHNIDDFRTVKAKDISGVRGLIFKNFVAGGGASISGGAVVDGRLKLLEKAALAPETLHLRKESVINSLIADKSVITASLATATLSAEMISLKAITASSLALSSFDKGAQVYITGDSLKASIPAINADSLKAGNLAVSGGIVEGDVFALKEGKISLAEGAVAVVYNVKTTPAAVSLEEGLDLYEFLEKTANLNVKLTEDITKKKAAAVEKVEEAEKTPPATIAEAPASETPAPEPQAEEVKK